MRDTRHEVAALLTLMASALGRLPPAVLWRMTFSNVISAVTAAAHCAAGHRHWSGAVNRLETINPGADFQHRGFLYSRATFRSCRRFN